MPLPFFSFFGRVFRHQLVVFSVILLPFPFDPEGVILKSFEIVTLLAVAVVCFQDGAGDEAFMLGIMAKAEQVLFVDNLRFPACENTLCIFLRGFL